VQAAINVIVGERYKEVTDENLLYALGFWREEEARFVEPNLRDRLLERPRAEEPARLNALISVDWYLRRPNDIEQDVKRLAVARIAAALLLSLGLLVSAAAQKVLANGATLIVASATADPMPHLEEAMDFGDEKLPAPGPAYLQPTIFCPVLFAPASKRSDSQTTDSAKKDLKLYQLKSVLLI